MVVYPGSLNTIASNLHSTITVISDVSGNWGCGAFAGNHWFMLQWAGPIASSHIIVKELALVVIAAVLWGEDWRGNSVLARCDNEAVVGITGAAVQSSSAVREDQLWG